MTLPSNYRRALYGIDLGRETVIKDPDSRVVGARLIHEIRKWRATLKKMATTRLNQSRWRKP